MTSSNKNAIQTRPGRCETHGLVDGTRKMPRLAAPFIVTGALRLAAGGDNTPVPLPPSAETAP